MVNGLNSTMGGVNLQSSTNTAQSVSQSEQDAKIIDVFAPKLTKMSLEALLLAVTSQAVDLQKQTLYNYALAIDNNNKELSQLNKANSDLSALLALFPKDGDDKTLGFLGLRRPKGSEPNDDDLVKKAVSDIFANPNAPLTELKSTNTNSDKEKQATTAMNKYLALVQSGIKSGVIKPEDQTKYQDMLTTKADLTALQQAIRTQTDDRSNISSKLQLSVNQYNNNVSNITQFIANLQSIFKQNLSGVVSKMG
jgi:hypothetical protein